MQPVRWNRPSKSVTTRKGGMAQAGLDSTDSSRGEPTSGPARRALSEGGLIAGEGLPPECRSSTPRATGRSVGWS
jgi:hypothetical protein